MIYYLFYLYYILISTAELLSYKFQNNLIFGAIVVVPTIILASFRTNTGTDWDAYWMMYQYPAGVEFIEYGYSTFNRLFSDLGLPYWFFLVVLNSICLSTVWIFIKKLSPLPSFGYLVYYSDYFFYYNLSGQRQAFAMAMGLAAISFFLNKMRIKSILWILFGFAFHVVCLFYLVLFFIPFKQISTRYIILIFFGLLAGSFLGTDFVDILKTYALKDYSSAYFNETAANTKYDIEVAYYVGMIRRFIIILFIILVHKEYFLDKINFYVFNMYALGFLIFAFLYVTFPDAAVRISSCLTLIEVILIGRVCAIKSDPFLKGAFFIIYAFMCLYKVFGYESLDVYHYNFII